MPNSDKRKKKSPGAKQPPEPSRSRSLRAGSRPADTAAAGGLTEPVARLSSEPPPAVPTAGGEYTLETLAKPLGPADAELREALFEDAEEAELVEAGTAVDSDTVLKDAPRFLGMAYDILTHLSPEQRKHVHLSPALLPLLLDETRALAKKKAAFDAQQAESAGGRAERQSAARREAKAGIAARDNAYDAIKNAVGKRQRAKLDEIVGTAETAEALAGGMEGLAGYVDELRRGAKARQKLRLEAFGVTAALSDGLRQKAARVRETGRITATPGGRVTQRLLDLQDGRCLFLIERILRAFRAAHREDASILIPELRALAWYFENNRRARSDKSPKAAPAQPKNPKNTDNN